MCVFVCECVWHQTPAAGEHHTYVYVCKYTCQAPCPCTERKRGRETGRQRETEREGGSTRERFGHGVRFALLQFHHCGLPGLKVRRNHRKSFHHSCCHDALWWCCPFWDLQHQISSAAWRLKQFIRVCWLLRRAYLVLRLLASPLPRILGCRQWCRPRRTAHRSLRSTHPRLRWARTRHKQ